jgi:hypothetical protein
MTPQEYIESELLKLKEPLEFEAVASEKLKEAILARVMSKKFRKLKADKPAFETAREAIRISVKKGEPIRLMLFFGGNKLWSLPESPEIDWGELFALIYYANWAKYISQVYKPGAVIEYFSMDIATIRMNNLTKEEVDLYAKGMRSLIKWIGPYLSNGVKIKYTRMGDLYNSYEDFIKEIDIAKKKWIDNNGILLPEMNDEKNMAVELNVRLNLGQDEDPDWRAKIELEHRGIFGTKIGGDYMWDPSLIPHCPTWYSGFVATGSTKKSLAKFWVGVGVLEKKGNSFNEIILSPKQLEKADFKWEKISIKGLDGKNFDKIRVLN